jgi:undecaprenyl-phosphate 4-deoxy-4-formamido-L-arabinose transferase
MVEHEERAAGESKYSLYSLIRLNFDLMTGFSLVPLQWFSMLGISSRSARRRCSYC